MLTEVVGATEEFLLAVEGAFDNVEITSVIKALERMDTDQQIIAWIGNVLICGVIHSWIGDSEARKIVSSVIEIPGDRGSNQVANSGGS